VSVASKNKITESYQITPTLSSSPLTTIERKITATGLMKEHMQKSLLLFEDYYADAMKEHGEYESFIQQYAASKKTRSFAEEWQNALAKARESYKDGFVEDIKGDYNVEPKELISYKINCSGIKLKEPEFIYTAKFVMADWIKKAGNNYLFEVGKVIGVQMQIKEEDRKRTIDVYGPFARSYEFLLQVNIPDGFGVEGLEALNKKIANECGSFSSTASLQGNQLKIQIQKEYTHNFEPAANWPKMLEFIDAAADFNNAKILLKKK
jgi:hypothetical protein